jgi:hypothetical protein
LIVANSRFWRFKQTALIFFDGVPSEIQKVDAKFFKRVAPGHAILVGDLNRKTECGEINWAGVIDSVSESEASIKIVWRNADFILKPTAAGRVYWRCLLLRESHLLDFAVFGAGAANRLGFASILLFRLWSWFGRLG